MIKIAKMICKRLRVRSQSGFQLYSRSTDVKLLATETGERGVKHAEEERDTSGAGFYKIKHIIGAS